jgi:hypothetical protein
MFIKVDTDYLNKYAENDYLLPIITGEMKWVTERISKSREYQNMINHQWKRAMFDSLYGDIVGEKVLDLAGSYCGVPNLIINNNYTLVDQDKILFDLENISFKNISFFNQRFQDFVPVEKYDVVIACDLFLSNSVFADFPDKFLPFCKEIRFSLTYRFFRQDKYAGYSLTDINDWLYKYCIEQKRNLEYVPISYEVQKELPNKRNVYLISLKGDL